MGAGRRRKGRSTSRRRTESPAVKSGMAEEAQCRATEEDINVVRNIWPAPKILLREKYQQNEVQNKGGAGPRSGGTKQKVAGGNYGLQSANSVAEGNKWVDVIAQFHRTVGQAGEDQRGVRWANRKERPRPQGRKQKSETSNRPSEQEILLRCRICKGQKGERVQDPEIKTRWPSLKQQKTYQGKQLNGRKNYLPLKGAFPPEGHQKQP